MKKSYLFRLLFMFAIFIGILWLGNSVQAGSITLRHLDFQIQLNEDGSMDVTENWNARINNTNTMFKDIEMDSSKFKEITNVEVYRVNSDNTKTKLTKIDEEMYHVTKDCYYGLVTSSGDFEIAWGVSVDGTEYRKYQIQYTVVDAIKTYQDCSELYWQLVGKENGIPVDALTATIYLPKAVQNKNNLRAWAHGPYNGNINLSSDRVILDLEYLDPETMVEARIATTENLFPENKTISSNHLATILEEEQAWADEANREREEYIKEQERQEIIEMVLGILTVIAMIGVAVFAIIKLILNFIKLAKIPKKQEPYIQYFRDIPDETASSGDAAFLYSFSNGGFAKYTSKVLSATLLQLSLKRYIAFSEDKTKKKPDVRINILKYSDRKGKRLPLKKDEQVVYELLIKVSKEKTFTMKEFEKYAKKHSSTFMKMIDKMGKQVEMEQQKLGNYNKSVMEKVTKYNNSAVLYIGLGIFLMGIMPFSAILLILNCIPHFMMSRKVRTLTDKGMEEAAKWKGLKRYMEDFSLLDEKEVPDLVLWEKYLIYATAFGIADKVLKQLKVKYPELQEIDGYEYSYMPLLYHSAFNTAFLTTFNNSVNKVYMGGLSARASSSGYSGGNYSSGGGFGGGFSGGGGFGGGGGRNGRKINIKNRENKRKTEKKREK